MKQWTFITRHALVLLHIYANPHSTIHEIASSLNVTDWTVHKIIADLAAEGYISQQRVGRNNVYQINLHLPLRYEAIRHAEVADLMNILFAQEQRSSRAN